MAEWLKAADSKSAVGATPPGVQIPLSPPDRLGIRGWVPGKSPRKSRRKNRGEMPERLKGHDWKSCVPPKGVPWVQIPPSPPREFDGPSTSAPRRVVAGPRAMEFREPRQVRKEAAVAGDFMCRGSSGCHPWRGGPRSCSSSEVVIARSAPVVPLARAPSGRVRCGSALAGPSHTGARGTWAFRAPRVGRSSTRPRAERPSGKRIAS